MSAPVDDAVLPPGLSAADFGRALRAFASALGAGRSPARTSASEPSPRTPSASRQVKAAYDVYRRLVRLTGEAGYGLYRGHIEFMDDIAAQYDWGDHAMLRLYGTLKYALDPDGILSPGKQGIWPSTMRES